MCGGSHRRLPHHLSGAGGAMDGGPVRGATMATATDHIITSLASATNELTATRDFGGGITTATSCRALVLRSSKTTISGPAAGNGHP